VVEPVETFKLAAFTNPLAVMLVPEALARVVLPVTLSAAPALMSPEVVRAVPDALVKLMRAALVSPETVRAVEETAERDERPETFRVAPFTNPLAVMLVEETLARVEVPVTVRVVKLGVAETLMVALVVPEIETLVPAVRREAMFWKVGVPEPWEVKSWLAEPTAEKAYAEPSEKETEPAEPMVDAFVPPLATPRTPLVIWLAEMAILEVETEVILPFASTVMVGTTVAEPYDPAVAPELARVKAPEEFTVASPERAWVTQSVPEPTKMFPAVAVVEPRATPLILATVGFGKVPERSPPAEPPGVTPVIVVVASEVILPSASTVARRV
jgi:hypothetical protein